MTRPSATPASDPTRVMPPSVPGFTRRSVTSSTGVPPTTCPTCRGQGRVRAQQGFFTIERTCSTCGGAGQVIKDPCRYCSGTGRIRKEKTLTPALEDLLKKALGEVAKSFA